MAPRKLLSIVVPVHNEAECVPLLYSEVIRCTEGLDLDLELVFVDDGSTDDSTGRILALREKDPRVKLVEFSRNFGHQMALAAGTRHARGDAVVHIDADLQHPPELIPRLVELWRQGFEIVETVRGGRIVAGWLKRTLSRLFYWVFNKVSTTPLDMNVADFRLLDRRCADALNRFQGRHIFLRGVTQAMGFKRTTLPFEPAPRAAGTPSYSLRKSLALAANGIFGFSDFPIRMAVLLGVITLSAGALYLVSGFILYFTTDLIVPGWFSTILLILVMGGLNLLFTGIFSIYVWHALDRLGDRPMYITRQTVGFDQDPDGP